MSQLSFEEFDDYVADSTYTVGEVAEAINGTLRSRFTDGLWVRGEIQGLASRGPHLYFRLVEEGEQGKAVLNVQFFAPQINRLRPILSKFRLRLAVGLRVRIHGYLDFYAPGGTIGLKMAGIDPRFTLGDLAQQRNEVVRRLVAAGLYDANRRVPLSPAPLRVGVVTSLDSAAWADFQHELERSAIAFEVRVADCRVQGEHAVAQVAAAITAFGRRDDIDVIVVIRGGGARSELATFDAEEIATAIGSSPHPVFTGLGHETDTSIADEVAHRTLKTPTACAAALVEVVREFVQRTELVWSGIGRVAARSLERSEQRLGDAARRIHLRTVAAVERSADGLDHRHTRLATASRRTLDDAERAAALAAGRLAGAARLVDRVEQQLGSIEAQVRILDPALTMARGWSITRRADGRVVRNAADLRPGDHLITTFALGSARSTVEETHR